MTRQLAQCLGCDREVPVTKTTTTAKGIVCPMCQSSEFDPRNVELAMRGAKEMGVAKEARPGKPLWGFKP